jgi:hypothetical protein
MRFRTVVVALIAGLALVASAVPAAAQRQPVPIAGASEVSAATMASWFRANKPAGTQCLEPGVSMDQLAKLYVKEGAKENIRGDIAFAQAILETGWFRFGCDGNNFAGIGVTTTGATGNAFPTPRIGVRAQIQHLVAYSKAGVRKRDLAHPCVDPRFSLVSPKGKAPTWNQMGDGNWAQDKKYGRKIINLYNGLRAYAGLPSVGNQI